MASRQRASLDPQMQRAADETRHGQLEARIDQRTHQRMDARGDRPARADFGAGLHRTEFNAQRPTYLYRSYRDRPDLITYRPHHFYTYYDVAHRLHHRVIWPTYQFWVGYRFGPYVTFGYVYPYYHRKYVFVSLGGYWPDDYYYMRYYWYGWHPYVWYGYYPVATEVVGETNNYYTYNYYGTSPDSQTGYPADEATAEELRARLQSQKAEPAPQTLADTRFDEGVKSFESGDYAAAAQEFASAMELSPEDMVLPFAYAQALFANGQYSESAAVLREALSKVSPKKEGVFYPRGLYANDDVLFAQIEKLVDQTEQSADNADLQLLLGYHLLGTGETGYAREPLEQASRDPKNAKAAAALLKLLDKLEKEAGPADKASPEMQTPPQAQTQNLSMVGAQPGESAASPMNATQGTAAVENAPAVPDAERTAGADSPKQDAASRLTQSAVTPADTPSVNKEDNVGW
jgi:thioredoxin-like negative regulator of GroEL